MATTTRIRLTPARIDGFSCGEGKEQDFLRDSEQPGLALRVTVTGNKGYVYEGKLAGRTIRVTLGDTKTLTLSEARGLAAEVRMTMRSGRDPRVLKAETVAADVAKRLVEKTLKEAAAEAQRHTLEKMLFSYCDYLQALGRDAHKDARSIFNLHVVEAWPKIADKPATEVTPEEVVDMMRLLFESGKGRTANKLRSYVRAAYAVAKSARTKPSIPVIFKDFKVIHYPAADTSPDSSKNKADKNPLHQDDLIIYWQAIKDVSDVRGALLRLHLLTGGQRIKQLVALLSTDVVDDAITIHDGKGRPGTEPRPHTLPLIPEAKKTMEEAMSAQKTQEETKPRGRLQSHGIAGVQDRHYDGHGYMAEKRKMLMALCSALEQKKAKITPLRSTAA